MRSHEPQLHPTGGSLLETIEDSGTEHPCGAIVWGLMWWARGGGGVPWTLNALGLSRDYKIPNHLGDVALFSLVPLHVLTHLCTFWIILLKDCWHLSFMWSFRLGHCRLHVIFQKYLLKLSFIRQLPVTPRERRAVWHRGLMEPRWRLEQTHQMKMQETNFLNVPRVSKLLRRWWKLRWAGVCIISSTDIDLWVLLEGSHVIVSVHLKTVYLNFVGLSLC